MVSGANGAISGSNKSKMASCLHVTQSLLLGDKINPVFESSGGWGRTPKIGGFNPPPRPPSPSSRIQTLIFE